MFVKIIGTNHYVWRAVDQEGEVLESFVTKTRDKASALKFLSKAMKRYGSLDLPNAATPTAASELAVGIEAAFMVPLPHCKAA